MYCPVIDHHGGVESVTGSCHQLTMNNQFSLMIDCGFVSGCSELVAKPQDNALSFPIDAVKALVLSHAHIDHIRREEHKTRQARLEAVIGRALADHAMVLIPALSIGRTQELLYKIYLSGTGRLEIVITGNGMCLGGRIVNYLKAMLGESWHNVILVGYQANNIPSAVIRKYAPKEGYVELDGERIAIKAGITTRGGYSAHADQQELLSCITERASWPKEIRWVHGELKAKQALSECIQRNYALQKKTVRVEISND